MPRKSCTKPKAEVDVEAPKVKRSPDIQWAKNPDWAYTLNAYLGDHVAFRLKLFSDSTADATREGRVKHTAKDGKVQQYAVLAKHIFDTEPGQSSLYLQNPGRYSAAVADSDDQFSIPNDGQQIIGIKGIHIFWT